MISEIGNNYLTGAGNSTNQYDTRFSTMVNWYYQHRDSTWESFYWGPIIWSSDTSGLGSWDRPQMLVLGHWLDCSFPGYRYSKTYFGVCNRDGSNGAYNVYHDVIDTNALYDDAYRRYFGIPKLTRDSSQTGTDGAGQTYKVRKNSFGRPDDTSKTLTFIALRYPSGTTKNSTSDVTVTLPSVPSGAPHNWCELLPTGVWASSVAGGSTFALRNIEARIYSCDTALSDSGIPIIPNVRYVAIDSIVHDFSGEKDSLQFRVKTNNVATNADSTIIAYSLVGHGSIDSSITARRKAVAYTANSTVTIKDTITMTEIDQVYVKAWTKSNTLGKFSEPVDAFRTFSGPSAASTDTSISIGSGSATEGNVGTTTMSFIVTMTAARGVATTFTATTANGTASSGTDYTAFSAQTETIEAGHTADTVFVTVAGDTDYESDETLTVTIASPSSPVLLGLATVGVGTITNDDAAPATPKIAKLSGKLKISGTVKIQ